MERRCVSLHSRSPALPLAHAERQWPPGKPLRLRTLRLLNFVESRFSSGVDCWAVGFTPQKFLSLPTRLRWSSMTPYLGPRRKPVGHLIKKGFADPCHPEIQLLSNLNRIMLAHRSPDVALMSD